MRYVLVDKNIPTEYVTSEDIQTGYSVLLGKKAFEWAVIATKHYPNLKALYQHPKGYYMEIC
jgi:hypothetical protein